MLLGRTESYAITPEKGHVPKLKAVDGAGRDQMMSGACGDFHMSTGELWFLSFSESSQGSGDHKVKINGHLYSVNFIFVCFVCLPRSPYSLTLHFYQSTRLGFPLTAKLRSPASLAASAVL